MYFCGIILMLIFIEVRKLEEKIGFTIGKFAPLHKGHQFLIETALKEMDKVIVVVYDTDVTKVPTEERASWIKELYPNVEVRFAHNPPSKYGLDKDSVDIQMKYLSEIVKDEKPTHFYSSEPYGKYVAEYLNIEDRRVDTERKEVPISASIVRKDIERNKKWMDNLVYQDLKDKGVTNE